MPGSTPNFGFPFPLVGESPAGHTQMQDLAMALDGGLGGLGVWNSYTPSVTGALTVGNGTVTGKLTVMGQTVFLHVQITLGTTSAWGTGKIDISVPAAPRAWSGASGVAWDSSAQAAYFLQGFSAGTQIYLFPWPVASGNPPPFTASVPFPWEAGDIIAMSTWYEVP